VLDARNAGVVHACACKKAHDGTRQGQHFVCEGNLDSDFEKFMVAPPISVSTSTCASAVKYLLNLWGIIKEVQFTPKRKCVCLYIYIYIYIYVIKTIAGICPNAWNMAS
jgi:hypothetical protein